MEILTDKAGRKVAIESLIGGRSENQDSFGVAETPLGLLVVVCDGMGGGPGGKTASSIATQTIIDYVCNARHGVHKGSVLADAASAANDDVLAAVIKNPILKGMGTTCVCLLLDGQQAYISHVGDSRCYQLRGNRALFRTADHSYVGELVRHGTLTEEKARNSQYSNVITRAIGVEPTVNAEIDVVDYKPGDRFALMSDGIWGAIPEAQLVKFLTNPAKPSRIVPEIADNIDSLGKDNGGGHDNLTLAIVDVPGNKAAADQSAPQRVAPMAQPTPAQPVRPSAPQKSQPAPKAEKRSPKPEKGDTDTQDSEQKKNKKLTYLAFILGMIIVGCIVYIICLLTLRGGEDKKDEQAIIQQEEQLLREDNETQTQTQTQPEATTPPAQKQTPTTKPQQETPVNPAIKDEAKKILDQQNTKKEEEPQTKHQPDSAPEKTLDNKDFNDALNLLKSLKDDPNSKGGNRTREDKAKIVDQIRDKMDKGIAYCPNEAVKVKAQEILKEITANKSKLTQMDPKQLSTKEANETIDALAKKISALSK